MAGSGIHVSLIEPGPIESRFRENALAMWREHIDAEHSVHKSYYRAPRYHVTFPTHLFALLRRLLSSRSMDRTLLKVSGGGKR